MCEIKHVDFYASDWNDGTCDLTLEERGLYITAIAQIYSRGGPVERDRLKRACGVHGRTFNAILGRLLALGKLTEQDGMISQKRAEKELKKARKRSEKWLKNLENVEKSDTSPSRAQSKPPATSQNLSKSPIASQPESRPPRAPAREAHVAGAGLAGLADLKISEEMIVEATARRHAAGLPAINLSAEARKLEQQWEKARPRDPRKAWLAWALVARPDRSNVIELPRISDEEERRQIGEAMERGVAKLRAKQAMEATA